MLRGKRKELADMYGPPREGRPGTEKGKEETENEKVSYTAYLEDNTLQRARTMCVPLVNASRSENSLMVAASPRL